MQPDTTPLFLKDAQELARLIIQAKDNAPPYSVEYKPAAVTKQDIDDAEKATDLAFKALLASMTPEQTKLRDKLQELQDVPRKKRSEEQIAAARQAWIDSFVDQPNKPLWDAVVAAEQEQLALYNKMSVVKQDATVTVEAPKGMSYARVAAAASLITAAIRRGIELDEDDIAPVCLEENNGNHRYSVSLKEHGHTMDLREKLEWLKSDEVKQLFAKPSCVSQIKIPGKHVPGYQVTSSYCHEAPDPVYRSMENYLMALAGTAHTDDIQHLSELAGKFVPTIEMECDAIAIDRQAVRCSEAYGKEILAYFGIDPRMVKTGYSQDLQ
jgi:hypothetical protein